MDYSSPQPSYGTPAAPPQESGTPKSIIFLIIIFIGVLASSIAIGYFVINDSDQESRINVNGTAIKKNETVTILSSQILKKQIEGIFAIGDYYSKRPELIRFIQDNNWGEAGKSVSAILDETPESNHEIELFFLTDTEGNAKFSMPPSSVVGQNLAFRDWYRGVSDQWLPYLSEVYIRFADPQYNIVSFMLPIKNTDNQPIGILGIQVRLDIFDNWISDIRLGRDGKTFIVDQNGTIVAHPDIKPQEELVSYAEDKDVQNVLNGKTGTDIILSADQKYLSSFVPLTVNKWAVITRIPLEEVSDVSEDGLPEPTNLLVLIILISNIIIAIVFWGIIKSIIKKSA
ncbi:MAG: cache domain-containing protein [bacterium]|nr:cache domain-containing protein [bacterium]